jgi:hypothetical protein
MKTQVLREAWDKVTHAFAMRMAKLSHLNPGWTPPRHRRPR